MMRFKLPATRTLKFMGNQTQLAQHNLRCRQAELSCCTCSKSKWRETTPKIISKGFWQLRIQAPPIMQVSMHTKGWMDEEGIYHFTCLFSFRSVMYQITEHVLSSMYHIDANLILIVGEFVYIWSPFDYFSAYVWVYR